MSNQVAESSSRPRPHGAFRRLLAAALLRGMVGTALACAAAVASAADPSQFTEAERQLFVRPHLAAVSPPTRLHYRYERTGTLQPQVTDQATLTLTTQDGRRNAAVDFLSDDRRLELPKIDYVEQNPIILHFLEREVRQLKQLTGGAVSFYRNRIRKALAGDAAVKQTRFSFEGRMVDGVEIRIDPYVDDPARSRFEKFAGRYYVMVLSGEVPGEVYQLKAQLPAVSGSSADGMVHAEVLTFERKEQGG
jgi:hypothetical protein